MPKNMSDAEIRAELDKCWAAFEELGGRGVALADRIDELTAEQDRRKTYGR